MNRRGVTILELLISIIMTSVVVLLLIKVIFAFGKINNDETYASNDEISRAEIIKIIEKDFLKLNLEGLEISENNSGVTIVFKYENSNKELIIKDNSLMYDNTLYELKSNKATYSKCINYSYKVLDNDYYLVKVDIPVLIDGKNTTINDDLTLTYLSLINDNNDYPTSYSCSK